MDSNVSKAKNIWNHIVAKCVVWRRSSLRYPMLDAMIILFVVMFLEFLGPLIQRGTKKPRRSRLVVVHF